MAELQPGPDSPMLCHTVTCSSGLQGVDVPNREQRALVDELAALPSLQGCSKDDLRALAETGSVRTLPDGWAFVQEGTPADAAYVLLEGEANVLSGRDVIATLTPGAILVEMAYVEGGQRRATVATHGRVLRLDYAKLGDLLKKRPALKDVLRDVDLQHRGGKD
jgi:CRP/FNR family cyclic AMP-dependent transcriptional regulator